MQSDETGYETMLMINQKEQLSTYTSTKILQYMHKFEMYTNNSV
jgi:hypothetical protein